MYLENLLNGWRESNEGDAITLERPLVNPLKSGVIILERLSPSLWEEPMTTPIVIKNYKGRRGQTYIDVHVATQFLTHVLINFQKNPKIAKKHWKSKKYIFNTFASFLAFLASSQKNLNFQRHLERVQLLTRYF